MTTVMLFLWLHKVTVFLLIALSLWIGGMTVYFKGYIQRWMHRGRRHSWGVDMERKIAFRNGKIEAAPESMGLHLK